MEDEFVIPDPKEFVESIVHYLASLTQVMSVSGLFSSTMRAGNLFGDLLSGADDETESNRRSRRKLNGLLKEILGLGDGFTVTQVEEKVKSLCRVELPTGEVQWLCNICKQKGSH